MPTSPPHGSAVGPSLSPLKGGEGKGDRRCISLSPLKGGEAKGERRCISLSALGGGEGRGEVGDSRAVR